MQRGDVGRQIRLNRVMNPRTGKMIIIPLDHGIVGTILGIESPASTIGRVAAGGADSVLFNTGLARSVFQAYMGKCGAIHNLTNCAVDKSKQTLLGGVEQAVRLGADAVSVQITLGSPDEQRMLVNYQAVYDDCSRWDVPILLMSYFNREAVGQRTWTDCVVQCARVGAELGADIVKVPYTGDRASFEKVVQSCPIPVVVAGGTKKDDVAETLRMVRDVMDAGAAGVAMGRNVWQYPEPEKLVKALVLLVHHGASVEEGLASLNE